MRSKGKFRQFSVLALRHARFGCRGQLDCSLAVGPAASQLELASESRSSLSWSASRVPEFLESALGEARTGKSGVADPWVAELKDFRLDQASGR